MKEQDEQTRTEVAHRWLLWRAKIIQNMGLSLVG